MEKSIKSLAINYGIYLGVLLSLFTVLSYAFKLEILVNFWIIFLILPIVMIIFGIVSTAKSKSVLGGFINFRVAFSSYFITIFFGLLISTLVSVVLFNFIDPDAAETLKEIAIEKTLAFMERMGAPEDQITQQIEAIEAQDTQSFGSQAFQFAQSLIFFTVIGLIVALIMKKKDPNEA